MSYFQNVGIKDGANLDAFSRLRVSSPSPIFDAQFTYDLQPLLFESIINQGGGTATIAHDTTNRCALMTFTTVGASGTAYLQSYEHFRYQAGRSQLIFITFNMNGGVSGITKFAGYSDQGIEGIEFQLAGTTPQFVINTATTAGTQTVALSAANIDKFDGSGPSGLTLAFDRPQILVIDLQALYVGRVRVGFDVDGSIHYAHEFRNTNNSGILYPYVKTANLPIRCGMTRTSGTVSSTMLFICSSVMSEGGSTDSQGYHFSQGSGSVTAGSGTRTHMLSLQPKTTFNSLNYNRSKFVFESLSFVVTGANPVLWELVLGDAITGTTTFLDINSATYCATQYNILGTTGGSPPIVISSGYCGASASVKESKDVGVSFRYPITLDAAGAARVLGRLTFLTTGIGGTSACQVVLNWKEIR